MTTSLPTIMSDFQEELDKAQEFLSRNDQEEKTTMTDIVASFNTMRKKYADALEKQEKRLLKQCLGIYTKRRKRVNDFVNDIAHGRVTNGNAKSRMSRLVETTSRVHIHEDMAYFDATMHTLFDRVQLFSIADHPKVLECVAGFTKIAEVETANCLNDAPQDTPILYPTSQAKISNTRVKCQFDAPTDPGEYMLDLTGVAANKSRIFAPVSIRQYPLKLSVPLSEIVSSNARHCTIENGKLYVSNRDNPYISVYDVNTGELKGTLRGEFKKSRGIIATDKCLYISDASRNQFARITTADSPQTVWFSSNSCKDELNYPLGIKMSENGKLFVASMEARKIVVFKPVKTEEEWVVERSLGLPYKPYDLAFDSRNDMHVVFGDKDENIDRIFVYSPISGEYIREYGEGKITCPGGIAIDKKDSSYVTEYREDGRLVIFDTVGHSVSCSPPLDYPMGVCGNKDGSVFVASNLSHHILRF